MVRVGIIGLGFMGRMHYGAYQDVPGAQVVAVCDADPKRASGDLSDGWSNVPGADVKQLPMDRIKGTRDWRDLIANPDVDLIDVCLPTPQHLEVVIPAIESGKHVLCEKPMARTLADGQAIAAAAANAKGFFMPAMCMRFWGEWEWLKQAVAEKRYGEVRSATFRRAGTTPAGWFRNGNSPAARCSTFTSTTSISSITSSASRKASSPADTPKTPASSITSLPNTCTTPPQSSLPRARGAWRMDSASGCSST